jgi:hypothetical protein
MQILGVVTLGVAIFLADVLVGRRRGRRGTTG